MHVFALHLLAAIFVNSRSGTFANYTENQPNGIKNSGLSVFHTPLTNIHVLAS